MTELFEEFDVKHRTPRAAHDRICIVPHCKADARDEKPRHPLRRLEDVLLDLHARASG